MEPTWRYTRESELKIGTKISEDRKELSGTTSGDSVFEPAACILALVCLALIGLICFLPTAKHVGFYLDDWVMLNTLSRGPDGFWELFTYYFSADPRVVKRPVEALHFVTKFSCFADRPMGYHVANIFMEAGAAWLLYLSLFRITRQRASALAAAIFFFLYPSHNSTHYWVVCGSVTLSQILYLGSLYLNIEGAYRNKPLLHVGAGVLFLISLLNYEIFLPLCVLNIVLVLLISWTQSDRAGAIKSAGLAMGLFTLCVGMLGAYVKFIVPLLGTAWLHGVKYDPGLMVRTLTSGLGISLPWISFPYFSRFFEFKLQQGLNSTELLLLLLTVIIALGSIFLMSRFDRKSALEEKSACIFNVVNFFNLPDRKNMALCLFLIGSAVVFLSYTIFGVNESYMPTFLTLVNRMNSGASIGVGLVFSAILIAVSSLGEGSRKWKNALSIISGVSLLFFLVVCTWAMSRPYVLSWQLQSRIWNAVASKRDSLKEAKNLLLINVPRYVDEAPLFDGVWDFQSMARMTLKRKEIMCGVVGERFRFSRKRIQDVQNNLVLASYDFKNMYVLVSPSCELIKVETAEELLNLIAERGMEFENDKSLVEKWRRQIAENEDLEINQIKVIEETFNQ